eukprot:TRINITY_DN3864_c0_g1_i1.p1 TRINITY_DN3864_c0_g1~~TRINITY_DN3864_c0_g1_i1.p1  ORF type:complete len:1009 (+),score=187.27 TRINITY_DN3864_c0_g1_i1:136-3162(+)
MTKMGATPTSLVVAVAVLLLSLASLSSAQTTYYVSVAGHSSNDGLSPYTPLLTIQEGVDIAVPGDTVVVLPGTYTDAGNCGVVVDKTITLAGTGDPSSTVIDCEESGRVLNVIGPNDNLFGFTVQPIFNGLTFTNGLAANDESHGGAAYVGGARPTFVACVFSNSEAAVGGAVFVDVYSVAVFFNSKFTNNVAITSGAAVFSQALATIFNGTLITRSSGGSHAVIISASATSTYAFYDTTFSDSTTGAIGINSGEGYLEKVLIENISNAPSAAAIMVPSGPQQINITDTVINNVEATGSWIVSVECGFLIDNLTVQNCLCQTATINLQHGASKSLDQSVFANSVVRRNEAKLTSGGMFVTGISPGGFLVDNVLFEDNKATFFGGAVDVTIPAGGANDVVFRDVTFRSNSVAARGGAVAMENSRGDFINCVFEDNHCDSLGGAILMLNLDSRAAETVNIFGCTFKGNDATLGGAIFNDRMILNVDADTVFESNTARYGGGIFIQDNTTAYSVSDKTLFSKNEATLAGGAMFFRGITHPLLPDIDDCNCKKNKAGYGDDYATDPVDMTVDVSPKTKQLKNIDNAHTKIKADVRLLDDYKQKVAGQDIVFFADVSDDAYLVDADSISNGDPLESIQTKDGEVEFHFAVAGTLGDKYDIAFTTAEYSNLEVIAFSSSINECEDDEYEDFYPPGVPQYTTCNDVSFQDQTSGMVIVAWIFGVLAGIGLLVALISYPVMIIFRDRKVISYASPIFLHIILFGVCLGYAAVFPWIVEPSDVSCAFRPILILLAFGIALTPLIMKNWRIYRLESNKTMATVKIPNWQLLIAVGVVVCGEVVIIVLWMAWSRPYQSWHYDDDTDDTRLKNCESDHTTTMLIIAAVYNGLIVIVALFLAFKTRGVVEGFNESRWIAVIVYAIAFAVVLIFPLTILSDDPTLINVLVVAGVWACTTIVYLCLFGNRFFTLFLRGDQKDGWGGTDTWKSTRAMSMDTMMHVNEGPSSPRRNENVSRSVPM